LQPDTSLDVVIGIAQVQLNTTLGSNRWIWKS